MTRAATTRPPLQAPPPSRLAYRVGEAAEALGVSLDFFTKHVAPELRWVRRGSVKLVSRAELERWLDREAHFTLGDREALR